MALRSANINVMIAAAEKAAKMLLRDFNEIVQLQGSQNSPLDFARRAFAKAGQSMKEDLTIVRREFKVIDLFSTPLNNEALTKLTTDHQELFLITPVDAEMNYVHGLPFWSICISYIKNQKTKAVIIFDPINNEMFWAQFGVGAYMNNQRGFVSKRAKVSQCMISVTKLQNCLKTCAKEGSSLSKIIEQAAAVREIGSPLLQLAYLACARFDLVCMSSADVSFKALGIMELLMNEAKGYHKELAQNSGYVATNEQLMKLIIS